MHSAPTTTSKVVCMYLPPFRYPQKFGEVSGEMARYTALFLPYYLIPPDFGSNMFQDIFSPLDFIIMCGTTVYLYSIKKTKFTQVLTGHRHIN